MRSLPLYNQTGYPVDHEAPLTRTTTCDRCSIGASMAEAGRSTCLGPVGSAGGILVVGDWPTRDDERLGRPGTGGSAVWLRDRIKALVPAGTPIAFVPALGCNPYNDARVAAVKKYDPKKHLDACRPYLADTIQSGKPTRILAVGAYAAQALAGERVYSTWLAGAYGHVRVDGGLVPFFVLPEAKAARQNRFLSKQFIRDLTHALTANPMPAPWDEEYDLIETEADARAAVDEILSAGWSTFDAETAGRLWDPSFTLLNMGICAPLTEPDAMRPSGLRAWVWGAKALANPGARRELARYAEARGHCKIAHNGKFDVNCFISADVATRVNDVGGDTRLWRKLLEPESSGYLADLAWLVGMGGTKEEIETQEAEARKWLDKYKRARQAEAKMVEYNARVEAGLELTATGKRKKLKALSDDAVASISRWYALEAQSPEVTRYIEEEFWTGRVEYGNFAKALIEPTVRDAYNARDCVTTARIKLLEQEQLADFADTIDRVRSEVVDRAAIAVQRIEQWGITCNMGALAAFEAHCDKHLAEADKLVTDIAASFGMDDFNSSSPPQVASLLFDKIGLRIPDPKQGRSTKADVLKQLQGKHKVIDGMLAYRKYEKLQGTYARGMRPHVRSSGRIHPSILLDGTRTGRASSENPNGQNIPKRGAEGKMARGIFTASPGRRLVSLDYAQVELRIAAALSGDEEMISIFQQGLDLHTRTAQMISKFWGIEPHEIQEVHRDAAKTVNFGVLYGMSPGALAHKLKCSYSEAEALMAAILGRFRKLAAFLEECRAQVQKTGYTWTRWGNGRARRRPLFDVASHDGQLASRAVNGAGNTPIQGTASDFCLASLAGCTEWIMEDGFENDIALILPVHDQLLFDVDQELVQLTINTAREIMLGWNSWGVPLEVDCEVGPSWGALEKFKYNADEGLWLPKAA